MKIGDFFEKKIQTIQPLQINNIFLFRHEPHDVVPTPKTNNIKTKIHPLPLVKYIAYQIEFLMKKINKIALKLSPACFTLNPYLRRLTKR